MGSIAQIALVVLAMYLVSKTGAKRLMLASVIRSARATPDIFIMMADKAQPHMEVAAI
jgi:hypothetical protein